LTQVNIYKFFIFFCITMIEITTKQKLLESISKCKLREPVEMEMKRIISMCVSPFKEQLLNSLGYNVPATLEYNKRFRPYLIELSSQAAWLELDDAFVKTATWVEMKHQASLIIDDIQDWWLIRCWKESAWKKYWLNTALDLAYYLAASSEPSSLAKSYFWTKWCKLHDYLMFKQQCLSNMVCWQELDLIANKWWKTIEDYFNIVDWKTWSLINIALHSWSMPYQDLYTEEKSQALTNFSMLLARLYQIKDDIDDINKNKELDPSNIYYYVDQNSEKLNSLCKNLLKQLFIAHDKLKELKIVKYDYLLDLAEVLLPEEEFKFNINKIE